MNVCLQPSPTRFFFVNNYNISLEFDKIEFFRFELGRENGLISLLKLVTWLLLVKYAERRISLTSPVFMTIEIILHHITSTFVAFFGVRTVLKQSSSQQRQYSRYSLLCFRHIYE